MVTLFTNDCVICRNVKARLTKLGAGVREVELDQAVASLLYRKGGHRSAPVLTDGELWWSGYDCIVALDGDEVNLDAEPFDWRSFLNDDD